MDFDLDEDLQDFQALARRILSDAATPDRLTELSTAGRIIDDELWRTITAAGLVAAPLPESVGGAGLGLGGLSVLLEEQGRHVAPLPLWSTGAAALILAAHPDQLPEGLLQSLAAGEQRVGLAFEEAGSPGSAAPRCRATLSDGRWSLTGEKAGVPSAETLDHVLVPGLSDDGVRLFLVATGAPGVRWEYAETTARDRAGQLRLDRADARVVGDAHTVPAALRVARVALSAVQLGVAEGALRIAATYLAQREQFGRPLGSLQAVQHQLADCWIAIEAIRVTLWQAISDLAQSDGRHDPAADGSVAVARWWSGQSGLDVVHRVQHLHGGIGVDIDYPVHRYFLWGRELSAVLGGPDTLLEELGDVIAAGEGVPA